MCRNSSKNFQLYLFNNRVKWSKEEVKNVIIEAVDEEVKEIPITTPDDEIKRIIKRAIREEVKTVVNTRQQYEEMKQLVTDEFFSGNWVVNKLVMPRMQAIM